ncbi:MAG: hypothetical protein QOI51_486 [Nocardioidaceae bacterium]|jgi:hypothetical protein|nr:hypothetical protein [Nocardioidaceae bacterium]
MRRPHLSTGAWIFASVIAASVIAPTAVYAAVNSTVAIGDSRTGATVNVTSDHQLLTTTVGPKSVVTGWGQGSGSCGVVYSPPAGKAVVVTSVTYDMYNNSSGNDSYAFLEDAGCPGGIYDVADTHQLAETETRTFPVGLPMPSVGIFAPVANANVLVSFTGYLIPASQLPAAAPAAKVPARPHATH